MSTSDDENMLDLEPVSSVNKGKGKAVEPMESEAPDGDNLPWYAHTCAADRCLIMTQIGLRNTGQSH
jgi:hypothetical protein